VHSCTHPERVTSIQFKLSFNKNHTYNSFNLCVYIYLSSCSSFLFIYTYLLSCDFSLHECLPVLFNVLVKYRFLTYMHIYICILHHYTTRILCFITTIVPLPSNNYISLSFYSLAESNTGCILLSLFFYLHLILHLERKDLESRRKTRKFEERDAEERSVCARC
jgi:hypothetical protein